MPSQLSISLILKEVKLVVDIKPELMMYISTFMIKLIIC